MAEQELEDGEFRPDQQMDPYFLSSIDARVDKLMGGFGKKIEKKMNHYTVFNQYDSFMCDPLLRPKPPNFVVSSVLDDMIAAVEYEPRSRDHQVLLRDNVSISPKLAEVHQCSRLTLPWSILSPSSLSHITSRAPADKILKVVPNSEETQVKDTRSVGLSKQNPSAHNCSRSAMAGTMHPLKPIISHNLSGAKICEVADDSNCINGNDVPSAGFLKENVPPTVRPLTMAKAAHILEGTQTRARESGSSKDNPSVHHCSPMTRHRHKPITHSFSRDAHNYNNKAKVACNSEATQSRDRLSVGFSKDNLIARQSSPTLHPQARHPLKLVIQNFARASDDKIGEVAHSSKVIQGKDRRSLDFFKETPSARKGSPTNWPQARHPLRPVSENICRAPNNKIGEASQKSEVNQAKDRKSVGVSKENLSARQFFPAARLSPKLVSCNVSRTPDNKIEKDVLQGMQANNIPSMGSSRESPSAHGSSHTMMPQKRQPPKPLTQNVSRVRDSKIVKVAHNPEGTSAMGRQTAGFSKEKPSARQCSPTTLPQAKQPSKLSPNASRSSIDKIDEFPHDSYGVQDKDRPYAACLKENVSLGKESGKDARLENENPKTKLSGVTEAAASNAVAKKGSTVEWAGCDICNKWRLLPYGTNTAGLPDKWNCKMQTWLPGLNKCSISEEESGKAFHDLYPIPVFKNGSNLNGHHDSDASHIRRSEKADCATKKQKLKSSGESQAGQRGKKKLKFIDEIYNSHDVIAASDTGKPQKDDCASKKQKGRSWEESQAGQNTGNKKITDESRGSYLRKQKKTAYSSLSKILETEKLAGRKRRINEATVSQKIADDDVDCASGGLCGIKKKKDSSLENIYLDNHSAVEQKKLENFSSFSGQEGHLSSRNGSTHGNEVDHKESDNNQNTAHLCGMGHPNPDVGDVRCTIRKCNNSATIHVLKEATDLKDTAQCLEDEGLRIESTRLYFESALKYLHAASLLEPLGQDDIKCEDAIESIRYYAETSRICESCALEFERCEKSAAAALAYKCMEVAHFKVAFIQHSITSKDQKELQATFKKANPGDSSSSDPRGDCIKTPVWLDSFAMGKDASSPQTADNPIITAVSRPTYTRWLENATESICAFEASVKAQTTFGAASNRMGKEAKGLSSVKDVLDTNFHNIQELLRLIELSMASMNCKYR